MTGKCACSAKKASTGSDKRYASSKTVKKTEKKNSAAKSATERHSKKTKAKSPNSKKTKESPNSKKSSRVEHCKKYAQRTGCTYKEALTRARPSYGTLFKGKCTKEAEKHFKDSMKRCEPYCDPEYQSCEPNCGPEYDIRKKGEAVMVYTECRTRNNKELTKEKITKIAERFGLRLRPIDYYIIAERFGLRPIDYY